MFPSCSSLPLRHPPSVQITTAWITPRDPSHRSVSRIAPAFHYSKHFAGPSSAATKVLALCICHAYSFPVPFLIFSLVSASNWNFHVSHPTLTQLSRPQHIHYRWLHLLAIQQCSIRIAGTVRHNLHKHDSKIVPWDCTFAVKDDRFSIVQKSALWIYDNIVPIRTCNLTLSQCYLLLIQHGFQVRFENILFIFFLFSVVSSL